MWASPWSSRVVLGTVMLAVAGAGPARATPLTPTPFPLEGSTFEGADGDQADGSSNRDWHAVEAEGSLVHREDVNADDTAFVGGSKENRPFEWDLGAETGGVSPASVNIRDAWGTIEHVNAAPSSGSPSAGRRAAARHFWRSSSTRTGGVEQRSGAYPVQA